MAKSKNGGSRSMLRGRIGSDVYSVGKDGKGKRQQVVRSLAVQVSNPRTQSQMFGRMIMSTVMQAVSGLAPIIDHSFDGVAKGQPSISEFIRRNYSLVKADAVAHPDSDNAFCLNAYQEKGALAGCYVISDGSAALPAAVSVSGEYLMIELTAGTLTVGGLKAALGVSADGYLTFVMMNHAYGVTFYRAKLTTTLADSTAITSGNVGSLFSFEGLETPSVSLSTNTIIFEATDRGSFCPSGVIVSDYVDGQWKHSPCTLFAEGGAGHTADTVLPTYPVGTAQFLNGGDL